MYVVRLHIAVVLALAVLGSAQARLTSHEDSAKSSSAAHQKQTRLVRAKSASKLTKKQTPPKKKKKKPAKKKSGPFHGEVVKVQRGTSSVPGKVWVKHANGAIKSFSVTGTTAFTGSGVTSLTALTKGSIVDVSSAKKVASKINVSTLAGPWQPPSPMGLR